MANDKSGREWAKRRIKQRLILYGIILAVGIILSVLVENGVIQLDEPEQPSTQVQQEGQNQQNAPESVVSQDEELVLTMIEVGQADSFLLEQGDMTALIDCGTRSSGDDVVKYLKSQGIKRIDYLFGTHPHDDHMGGMYDVIMNIEVEKVIIPEVSVEQQTSAWYMKLMNELKNGGKNEKRPNYGGYDVEYVTLGTVYKLGDATIKVIGPMDDYYEDINNYSIVLKVTFGQMDVIMTGDAEAEAEAQILKSGENIDAEILKVGHHGSDTSSSEEFLDAISPDYALISAEVGNKFNHPTENTMEKLKEREIEVYRTDENGTVVVTITATDASFSTEPGDYASGIEVKERYGK